jgi:ADP-heptose:LPS heptosyltransferase
LISNIAIPSFTAEGLLGRSLRVDDHPRRIVVARLHAFGDAVITLPLLAGLRRACPQARLEIITSPEYTGLFEATTLTDHVWSLRTDRSRRSRLRSTLFLATRIGPIDLFVDLQRSTQSQLLRRMLRPRAWVAFDRFAPRPALTRYHDALEWVGVKGIAPTYDIPLRPGLREVARDLLGVDRGIPLVCLNPAGCWDTKRWPIERYRLLAEEFVERSGARIVLLGTGNVSDGAAYLRERLGDNVIDLVGRTTVAEALAVVQELSLMVSDDSGLMHLAWTSGIPTVAIFGATRSIWSAPMGEQTFCFTSEDLSCGACMQPGCARGDLLCLDRVTVEEVCSAGCGVRGQRVKGEG